VGLTNADRQRRYRQAHSSGLPPGRPVTAPCGTPSAYKRHRRHGERPCEACRLAWNEWQREYQRRRKGT
jgi:hypothetical protein